jgi:uncharacterized protein (TIGR02647 family)
MAFSDKMKEELDLILMFPSSSLMQGIKVHHDASPQRIDAAQRLFDKGVITQPDGGYLTDLGYDLADHARILRAALSGH